MVLNHVGVADYTTKAPSECYSNYKNS